jgi:hypothetical protein
MGATSRERPDRSSVRSVGLLKRMLGRAGDDSPDVRSLNACLVHAGGLLGVVGESYRQDALREVAARTTDASAFSNELVDYAADVASKEPHRRWFMAVLVREPDNEHDPLAVAVHAAGGRRLGYLTRENARAYGQVFKSLEKRGYEAAACPAMLNGGDGGQDYGVVLAISAPGYVLKDLTADEREAERDSHARQKDARARAVFEAALGGATWQEIADAHGYETTSGAYSAAHKYATKHGLELPPRRRGPHVD